MISRLPPDQDRSRIGSGQEGSTGVKGRRVQGLGPAPKTWLPVETPRVGLNGANGGADAKESRISLPLNSATAPLAPHGLNAPIARLCPSAPPDFGVRLSS